MTTERLLELGRAMYGPRWQREVARALGVADRTVRRWASGQSDIPAVVEVRLVGVARVRVGELLRVIGLEREAA